MPHSSRKSLYHFNNTNLVLQWSSGWEGNPILICFVGVFGLNEMSGGDARPAATSDTLLFQKSQCL